eukprot:CAMPEP_0183719998 /NCGR_PEP_ID=MMETSP0737-20130205/12747_1 /TAXON_ID=385413 /ORGANISM="Thalassiosira miniscula, Strain CCMP1093" /LENGTH=510 /DNA_ID=CAMNT_0025949797 /DNA_START=127 /DNA_END=1655 /DNA_ORIENTATION=+
MGNGDSSSSDARHNASNGHHQQQHEHDDYDDNVSYTSQSTNHSNGSNSRRIHKKHMDNNMDHIDEEHGYYSHNNKDHYERNALLPNKNAPQHSSIVNKKLKHKSSVVADSSKNSDGERSDGDDTNNKSQSDVRSRALFLKTAFWITCWYATSLATLFLNKIILSRPNSSVHVLGMCQMTTAAVLGGWSAFGGADRVQNAAMFLWRSFLPESVQGRVGLGAGGAKGGEYHHIKEEKRHNLEVSHANQETSPSKTDAKAGYSFNFVRDMSIVGCLRGLTVVLGLIALEHVPVSFVETIKATAPVFTVLFARLILQERTATPVMLTLVPVVAGLILCSAAELRFDTVGFVAAVMNNCADCVQNVMSKRMLTHLKPTQLQFYTSVAALMLQTPFVLRDATALIKKWSNHVNPDEVDLLLVEPVTEDDQMAESIEEGLSLTKLLIIDAIFYHLQSVSAYCTMGCMSPVSQSVANTLKRALLVWASILYFGNPVTNSGIVGIIMVVSGVFLYNHVR